MRSKKKVAKGTKDANTATPALTNEIFLELQTINISYMNQMNKNP